MMITFALCFQLSVMTVLAAGNCRQVEMRRLSIYAYIGNIYLTKSVKVTCQSEEGTCQNAFDGSSSSKNVWKPNTMPPSFVTSNINKSVMMGKILCEDNSCDCYRNKKLTLVFNNDHQQEAYIVVDPFDVRQQGWYRFDFPSITAENITITFPATGECEPKFIEIEVYSKGPFGTWLTNAPPMCTMGSAVKLLQIANFTPSGYMIFYRLNVTAECENSAQWEEVHISLRMGDDQTHSRTFWVEPLDKGSSTQVFVQQVERSQDKKVEMNITAAANFRVRVVGFYVNDNTELIRMLHANISCVRTTDPSAGATCQAENIIDNNITTFWKGSTNDTVTIAFPETIKPSQIEVLQEEIKQFSISYKSISKCQLVTVRNDFPTNGTKWTTIQPSKDTVADAITFTVIDAYSSEVKIMEINVYGESSKRTTKPTVITTSLTTSTTSGSTTTTSTTSSTTTTSTTTTTTTTATTTTTTTTPATPSKTSSSMSSMAGTSLSSSDEATDLTETSTPGISTTTKSTETTATTSQQATTADLASSTPTTARTTLTTTPSLAGKEKITYTVTMKILDVQYHSDMANNQTELYKDTNAKYVPLVEKAIRDLVGDRFINHIYDVWYKPGSIDMTYSFDVLGTEEIGITTLKNQLLNIFNQTGIQLDPSMTVKSKQIPEDGSNNEQLLLIGLAASLTSLAVVITTAITIICIRRRCSGKAPPPDNDSKDDDSSTLGQYSTGTMTYRYGRSERVWQRNESMVNQPWYDNFSFNSQRAAPTQGAVINSTPVIADGFDYPEQARNRFYDNSEELNDDRLDYFTDPVTVFTRPPDQLLRQGAATCDLSDNPSISDLELDDVMSEHKLTEGGFDKPSQNYVEHSFSRQVSNSTSVTTIPSCKLPKYYRRQDSEATYRGFFETETDSAVLGEAAQPTGLRRTQPQADVLHPARLPFRTEIVGDGNDSEISLETSSSESQIQDRMQCDSGYDEALKLYYMVPKLDDRNFIEKIFETFGRRTKADIIHRETPPYFKPDLKHHTQVNPKSKPKQESVA